MILRSFNASATLLSCIEHQRPLHDVKIAKNVFCNSYSKRFAFEGPGKNVRWNNEIGGRV